MNWRPRVVYGPGSTTIDFELAQRPWNFMPSAIGGRRIAGSGARATYKARADELVEKRIRFTEAEWPVVRAWLVWAQGPDSFDWYDDQDDALTLETVHLHAPELGQPIAPQRTGDDLSVLELTIVLRIASGAASTRAYFDPTPY